jgi:hypothetical protein
VRPVLDVPKKRRPYAIVAAVAATVAILAAAIVIVYARREQMPRTIAVLPFKPLVKGSGDVYLELGMPTR